MTTTPDNQIQNHSSPPVAPQVPHVVHLHGQEIEDPYAWLRDRDNPDVISYLEAENTYTEAVMASTASLQESLYEEMVGRIRETDHSVPVQVDGFFYYSRTEEGKQYAIFCRKKGDLETSEEVLLDLNQLAEGKSYLRLGAFEVSPDHRYLAYSLDDDGSEHFTLRILDLERSDLLAEEICGTSRSVEWDNDSRTLFYVTLDAMRRPSIVFRHCLGEDPSQDEEILHEADERFFVSMFKTRSRRFLGINLGSHTTSEVRYLDTENRQAGWRLLAPRQQDVEIYLDHHGEHFYLLTNQEARNFRLLKTPVNTPGRPFWEEVIAHREDEKLDAVNLFSSYMVVSLRSAGLRNLRICHLPSGEWHELEHDEAVYTVWCGENPMFETTELRFIYTSLVTPRSVYDYDLEKRGRVLRKQDEVLGSFDPTDYKSERLWVASSNGVEVPVSLVHRRDVDSKGRRPLLLYGYGSYGHSIDPTFSSARLSLLDRGFTFAIAHVRGGGEMGRAWYENGKLKHKGNTFTDFIAVADHLVAEGYTTPRQLVIRGGSAGGLLMGAVLNARPELFGAVLAEVPFVDVLHTMLDPSLPLTVIEYEEWGNPEERPWFEVIRAYSPYENVRAASYPHLLITAGLHDPRVQYFEPAKWTARLRSRKTDDHRLLLRTSMASGHSGASGRYDYLREEAFKLAFVLDVLGVAHKTTAPG
jgi:oligopeptidase B